MSLIRPLVEMQSQMDRLFSDLTQSVGFPTREEFTRSATEPRIWMPPIEVSETEEEYCIYAEIPGVKPDDLNVEVTGNILTISGESREEHREEKRNIHRCEIQYGRFLRRIPLPGEVRSENAKAEFKNGLLELHLPKAEESKRKRIKVSAR